MDGWMDFSCMEGGRKGESRGKKARIEYKNTSSLQRRKIKAPIKAKKRLEIIDPKKTDRPTFSSVVSQLQE